MSQGRILTTAEFTAQMETADRERPATMSTHLSVLDSGAFSPTSQVELLVKTFIVIMRISRNIKCKLHELQAVLHCFALLSFQTILSFRMAMVFGFLVCSLGTGDWLQQHSAKASHGNVEAPCCYKIHWSLDMSSAPWQLQVQMFSLVPYYRFTAERQAGARANLPLHQGSQCSPRRGRAMVELVGFLDNF